MAMTTQPKIDVSHLPEHAMDSRATLWWGNALMMMIEPTTVVLLLAVGFYSRRNFTDASPPPRVNEQPIIYDPVPRLTLGTINTILIVASCALMYWTDMAARRLDTKKSRVGLAIMLGVATVACAMRWFEFPKFFFKWDENAYASIVWWTLAMHFVYLLAAVGEFAFMLIWVLRRPMDEKHALDTTLAGGYWYWVAATWAVTYAVIYFGPRVLRHGT